MAFSVTTPVQSISMNRALASYFLRPQGTPSCAPPIAYNARRVRPCPGILQQLGKDVRFHLYDKKTFARIFLKKGDIIEISFVFGCQENLDTVRSQMKGSGTQTANKRWLYVRFSDCASVEETPVPGERAGLALVPCEADHLPSVWQPTGVKTGNVQMTGILLVKYSLWQKTKSRDKSRYFYPRVDLDVIYIK